MNPIGKRITVASLLNNEPDADRTTKRQKVDAHVNSAVLPSFKEATSMPSHPIQPSTSNDAQSYVPQYPQVQYPNSLVLYALQPMFVVQPVPVLVDNPEQVDVAPVEILHAVNNTQKQDKDQLAQILKLQLETLDLTPENGWSTDENDNKWRKGTKEELRSAFHPATSQDIKNRVSKVMTLLISPTKKEYVFVKRKANDISLDLCSNIKNAHLKPEYEKIVWKTIQSREIEWIKERVIDLCLGPVTQEYKRTTPESGVGKIGRVAIGSVLASFACYVKKSEIVPVESDNPND